MNIEKIINELEKMNISATKTKLSKNGIEMTGIQIMMKNTNFNPVFYTESFEDMDESEIAIKIKSYLPEVIIPESSDDVFAKLSDMNYLINNVYLRVQMNKDPDIIEIENELDIFAYIEVYMGTDNNLGNMSIKLTDGLLNQIAKKNERNKEDLFDEILFNAYFNTGNEREFKSLESLLHEMIPASEELPFETPLNSEMFVLTNKKRFNGAGLILDNVTMEEIRDKLKSDFYILPSSKHEILIIKMNEYADEAALKEMIKSVNDNDLDPKDLLSYHLYKYVNDDKKVTVVD